MRFLLFFIGFVAIIAMAYGSPVVQEEEAEEVDMLPLIYDFEEDFVMEPRITCDLIGNERLCVLHCLSKGFRGGWCDARKVCKCRR